jgi:predicted RNA-binding Zn ribbon-like protein
MLSGRIAEVLYLVNGMGIDVSPQAHRWKFHLGGRLCLDLANTVSWRSSARPIERLADYGDFLAWSRQTNVLTDREARALARAAARHPGRAAAALRRARAVREAIYLVFSALSRRQPPRAADLAILDGEFRAALRQLRLVREGAQFTVTSIPGGRALTRPLVAVARSVVDVLTTEDLRRLRTCPSARCGWLFLDTTRSGTRRWCDMKVCGNREKARRHYRRRRRRRAEGTR